MVVSRTRAEVPDCPNWSVPSQPNYNNRTMSNFGCAVNSNLAAMVANPEDLIHGREGDPRRSMRRPRRKASASTASTAPTGNGVCKDINTKRGN